MKDANTDRPLLLMTAGDLIQLTGAHFFTVAIATHTYSMTGSAWAYSLQMLLSYLPWMLLSGIAGPVVDRLDRKKVMVVAAMSRGFLGFLYPCFTTIGPVLALNFAASCGSVFLVTARTALIPSLAKKEALLKVNALRTAAFGCVDLVVPTLAGAVMGRMGTASAFRLISVLWVAGAAAFSFMGPIAKPGRLGAAASAPPRRGFTRDLRDAVSFLREQPALLASVAVYTVYAAGQHGANTLFYPYVESVLGRGAEIFGLSISFYFGANLLAGLVLARYGGALASLSAAVLAIPAALVWFGYSIVRSIPLILGMGFIEGIIMSMLTTLFMTEVQSKAPRAMTGRVWGVAYSLSSGGEVAGVLLAGAIAGRRGPLTGYRVLGGMILALATLSHVGARIASRGETRS